MDEDDECDQLKFNISSMGVHGGLEKENNAPEDWNYQLKACDVIFAFLNNTIGAIENDMTKVVAQAKKLEDYKSQTNIDYQKCYTYKVNENKKELQGLIRYLEKKTSFFLDIVTQYTNNQKKVLIAQYIHDRAKNHLTLLTETQDDLDVSVAKFNKQFDHQMAHM